MKILALTPSMPATPDRGVRIRCHHLLSRLAERHEISLLAVDDRAAGPRSSEQLAEFCERQEVHPLSPLGRAVRGSASLLRGEPIRNGWFAQPRLAATMERWLAEIEFDLVLVFSCSMAPYWLESARALRIPAVVDHIDTESAKWSDYARYAPPPRRWLYRHESGRLAALERRIEANCRASLVISDAELATLRAVVPDTRATALANGVDGGHFARPQLARRASPPSVVFVGQMDDGANVDAVLHFAQDILPRLRASRPELRFDVVGARPAPAIKALRRMPGVRVTGWVDDVRPYLWEGSVAVVPMRVAQGTQNKVLEAMAASLPVVASPLAARGIGASTGKHLRVAADAEHFADAVLDLLEDSAAAAEQMQAALEVIREHHSWDRSAAQLESILAEAARR